MPNNEFSQRSDSAFGSCPDKPISRVEKQNASTLGAPSDSQSRDPHRRDAERRRDNDATTPVSPAPLPSYPSIRQCEAATPVERIHKLFSQPNFAGDIECARVHDVHSAVRWACLKMRISCADLGIGPAELASDRSAVSCCDASNHDACRKAESEMTTTDLNTPNNRLNNKASVYMGCTHCDTGRRVVVKCHTIDLQLYSDVASVHDWTKHPGYNELVWSAELAQYPTVLTAKNPIVPELYDWCLFRSNRRRLTNCGYLCVVRELCDVSLCNWLMSSKTLPPVPNSPGETSNYATKTNDRRPKTTRLCGGQGAAALSNPGTRTSANHAIERIFFILVEHMNSLQTLNAAHHSDLHSENVLLCADKQHPADFMQCKVLLHDFEMCEGLVMFGNAPHEAPDGSINGDNNVSPGNDGGCTMTVSYPRSLSNSATWSYDLYRLTCDLIDIFHSQNLMSFLRLEFCQFLFGIVASQLTRNPRSFWKAFYTPKHQSQLSVLQGNRLPLLPVFSCGTALRSGSQAYIRNQTELSVMIHLRDRRNLHCNVFQPFILSGVTPRDIVGSARARELRVLKTCSWSPSKYLNAYRHDAGLLGLLNGSVTSEPSKLKPRLERCANVYKLKSALFCAPVFENDDPIDHNLDRHNQPSTTQEPETWALYATNEDILIKEHVMASWRKTKESDLIRQVVMETAKSIVENFQTEDDCNLHPSEVACTFNDTHSSKILCRCLTANIREGRGRYLRLCMLQSVLVIFYRWLTDEFHNNLKTNEDIACTGSAATVSKNTQDSHQQPVSTWWQRLFRSGHDSSSTRSPAYSDLHQHRRIACGMLASIMVVQRSDYHCMKLAKRLYATLCSTGFTKNLDYKKSEFFKYRAIKAAEHVILQSPLLTRIRDNGLSRHLPVPCMGLPYRSIDSRKWFLTLCHVSIDIESYTEMQPTHFVDVCRKLSASKKRHQ